MVLSLLGRVLLKSVVLFDAEFAVFIRFNLLVLECTSCMSENLLDSNVFKTSGS